MSASNAAAPGPVTPLCRVPSARFTSLIPPEGTNRNLTHYPSVRLRGMWLTSISVGGGRGHKRHRCLAGPAHLAEVRLHAARRRCRMWRWGRIDECPPRIAARSRWPSTELSNSQRRGRRHGTANKRGLRPWPGLTPAHRELTSVVQSRSEVNNPSCAPALPVPVSSNAAPSAIVGTLSAIIEDDFNMVAFLCVNPTPPPADQSGQPILFPLFGFVLSRGEQRLLLN